MTICPPTQSAARATARSNRGELSRSAAERHAEQCTARLVGVVTAYAMFGLPLLQTSIHARTGSAQWFSEFVATFGLVGVVRLCPGSQVAPAVGLYVLGAYWFTASTAFANPALTAARALTDTFSGIRPVDAPAFVVAQVAGALTASIVTRWVTPPEARR